MSFLLKNVTVSDPSSPFNGKTTDILVKKGIISAIGKKLTDKVSRVIEGQDLYVSQGWVDVMADYADPGYEHRETIESGLNAAAAGGFADVFIVPNTMPVLANRSTLDYVGKKAEGHRSRLHVLGAVSRNAEGKELAEMMDMHHGGAIAFSDGWKPLQNAGLLLKALEYVKAFDGIIVQLPIMRSLAEGGLMNEGEVSVRLGMSSIPNIAESIFVQRDIELLRYTGSRIHFSGISTPESLALIRAAKKEGLQVTCSVTPYHLLYTENDLVSYNSVFKVEPPLRSESERKALVRALTDGTIDCIASHHRPQDWDGKVSEFEYAQYGMIGQETCFAMLLEAAPKIEMSRWAELLAINPRRIFGLQSHTIAEGNPARFTIFDKDAKWIYDKSNKFSKAVNTPFADQELTGKAYIL